MVNDPTGPSSRAGYFIDEYQDMKVRRRPMNKANLQWDLPNIKPGLSKTIQKNITESDTLSFGRGALTELLATPTMTALMIEAAINTIDPLLPEGYVTIGESTSVTYLNPTFLGVTVTVIATLTEIAGRKLVFESMAFDELGQITRGRHERRIVNAEHFMQVAHKRCNQLKTILK
jgi:fluoroacetyl-CoA thioesterase